MSSKIKHAQRSHKTYGHNGSVFSGFERTAYVKAGDKQIKKNGGKSLDKIKAAFKNLFMRHQSR